MPRRTPLIEGEAHNLVLLRARSAHAKQMRAAKPLDYARTPIQDDPAIQASVAWSGIGSEM